MFELATGERLIAVQVCAIEERAHLRAGHGLGLAVDGDEDVSALGGGAMSEERLKHRLALLVGERGDELPGAGFARGDALGGLDVALGGTRAHGAGGARERPYGRRRVARRDPNGPCRG